MALKHDSQGFLTGDTIDMSRALDLWTDIRNDVKAIRGALSGSMLAANINTSQSASNDANRVNTQNGRKNKSVINQAVTMKSALPTGRDNKGRFHKKQNTESSEQDSALANIGSRLSSIADIASEKADEVDPAVKAFKEISQPIARGWGALTGGNDAKKQTRLLQRIFASLTGARLEQTAFNKSAKKSLKSIDDKTDQKGGSGLLGLLGLLFTGLMSLLGGIPVIGPLLTSLGVAIAGLIAKIVKLTGLATLFKKPPVIPTTAGGAAAKGGFLKGAGRMLKKVPLLGTLLSVGLGMFGSSQIEGDQSMSREEKNKAQGKNWGGVTGGLAGAYAGGTAGAMTGALIGSVVPVVGTAFGGVVGGIVGAVAGAFGGESIGALIGGIVGKNFTDISNSIKNKWNEATAVVVGTFNWIGGIAQNVWGNISAAASQVWSGISAGWAVIAGEITAVWSSIQVGWNEGVIKPAAEIWAKLKTDWETYVSGPAKQIWFDIANTFDEITSKLGGIFDVVASFLKDKLGIDIPGAFKVVSETVGNVVDSIGVGVKAAAANVARIFQGKNKTSLSDSINAERALTAGAEYNQGAVNGLDAQHTKALVALIASRESSGGKLDAKNTTTGAVGRYQAMPSWLASAGLIGGSPAKGAAMVRAAAKADGVDVEKAGWEGRWEQTRSSNGTTGGLSAFLANQANWTSGASLPQFLASAPMQDMAFKKNANLNYRQLVKSGSITSGTSQEQIIALLDAANLSGAGGVNKFTKNPSNSPKDANGDSIQARLKQDPPMIQALLAQIKPDIAPAAMPKAKVSIVSEPKMPAIPAVQPILDPLTGSDRNRSISITIPKPDVSQDLKDRRIAHIVTGGMA